MKRILFVLLILISSSVYSQVLQKQSSYGFEWNRGLFTTYLGVPKGLGGTGVAQAGYDTASLRYNVSDSSLYTWTGYQWRKVGGGGSSSAWSLTGDAGTTSANFIGTTDAQPLVFKVNGTEVGRFDTVTYGVALGRNLIASGMYATAFGDSAIASGNASTAMGSYTIASGAASTAIGGRTIASNSFSTAMGNGTTASGIYSTAMGAGTTASGYISTAMGNVTTASGDVSTAMGNGTTASGDYSTAMGYITTARSFAETSIGVNNEDYTTATPA